MTFDYPPLSHFVRHLPLKGEIELRLKDFLPHLGGGARRVEGAKSVKQPDLHKKRPGELSRQAFYPLPITNLTYEILIILFSFCLASSTLGNSIFKMPSLYSALILSIFTVSGIEKFLLKVV